MIKHLAVHDALIAKDKNALSRLRSEFTVLLNPDDQDDKQIIACISCPNEGKEMDHIDMFMQRVSFLLKHDWERVKLEAGSATMRVKYARDLLKKITYEPERGRIPS